VELVCADGRHGHQAGAPYDRIIVTTGARSIERDWIEQLADRGVLVTPLVDSAGTGVLVRCHRGEDGLTQHVIGPCAFLPMLD
jgi:protein-L-isoaspartate(D-aspartate) O-methyltransferase